MTLLLQLPQHFGHDDKLAARLGHRLDLEQAVRCDGAFFGSGREQVRMVGNLLQLHHDVEKRGLRARLCPQGFEVVGQDALVELSLHRRQVGSDDELGLGGHALQHVGLHSPKHVGTEELVQLVDLLFLSDVGEVRLEGT